MAAEGDTLFNIEDLYGSNYADVLWGDDGANLFFGFDGNDELVGRGGNTFWTAGWAGTRSWAATAPTRCSADLT